MTEQLELVEKGPKLTERQQRALDLITAAGREGLNGEELGDQLQAHPLYRRKTGHEVGQALKRKGLVAERKGKRYVAVNLPVSSQSPAGMLADDEEIPF